MTAPQWYWRHGGTQGGPVSWDKLQSMARSGTVGSDDFVWREGWSEWRPASEARDVAAETTGSPEGPPALPSAAGGPPPLPAAGGASMASIPVLPALPAGGAELSEMLHEDDGPEAHEGPPPFGGRGVGRSGDADANAGPLRTAVGAFAAALAGLLVMPLPMGLASVSIGWMALGGMKDRGSERGKGLAVGALVVGALDLGSWAWMAVAL